MRESRREVEGIGQEWESGNDRLAGRKVVRFQLLERESRCTGKSDVGTGQCIYI